MRAELVPEKGVTVVIAIIVLNVAAAVVAVAADDDDGDTNRCINENRKQIKSFS